jgi:hypothetical protein
MARVEVQAQGHAESFWRRFKAKLLDGGSFPGLARPSSKSATTSPSTTPDGGILRSVIWPPTTSKFNSTPRTSCVRLSWTTSKLLSLNRPRLPSYRFSKQLC